MRGAPLTFPLQKMHARVDFPALALEWALRHDVSRQLEEPLLGVGDLDGGVDGLSDRPRGSELASVRAEDFDRGRGVARGRADTIGEVAVRGLKGVVVVDERGSVG